MKIQKIGDIHPTLPFTEYDFLKKHSESFAVSELWRIHVMLPLKEMAEGLSSHLPKKHPPIFVYATLGRTHKIRLRSITEYPYVALRCYRK